MEPIYNLIEKYYKQQNDLINNTNFSDSYKDLLDNSINLRQKYIDELTKLKLEDPIADEMRNNLIQQEKEALEMQKESQGFSENGETVEDIVNGLEEVPVKDGKVSFDINENAKKSEVTEEEFKEGTIDGFNKEKDNLKERLQKEYDESKKKTKGEVNELTSLIEILKDEILHIMAPAKNHGVVHTDINQPSSCSDNVKLKSNIMLS